MAELLLIGVPVRLAKALLRMSSIRLDPKTGRHLHQVCLSQREIGSLIGARRESVNKWLGRCHRKGILQVAESLITIVDRRALEKLAQPESSRELYGDRLRPLGTKAAATEASLR